MARLHDGTEIADRVADVDPVEADFDELPPLGPKGLAHLKAEIAVDPHARCAVCSAVDAKVSDEELDAAILDAEAALARPDDAAEEIGRRWGKPVDTLPDFTFPGRDPVAIPINHRARKFETRADLLGWLLWTAPGIVGQRVASRRSRARFRWHDAGRFVYPLPAPPITVALFGDFGTGYYHALHIAKQIAAARPAAAIHLGDTYYAGRRAEIEAYLARPFRPMLADVPLWLLVGNHELYSGGHAWLRFLDEKRAASPATQAQVGTYFCLRAAGCQIVAAETEWWGRGSLGPPRLRAWLADRLREGRADGLANVLLTSYHPYTYGREGPSPLSRDTRELVGLVDLWAWGNTHYAALFDRSEAYPFVGVCLGHAGYPFDRTSPGGSEPAPLRWLETGTRFPEETGIRPDRGLNGYAMLDLGPDGPATLRFVDWMGRTRRVADLRRTPDGIKIVSVRS
ncbi:MAG: metallophosphoesterase family protein [Myxococcota bacterium]